MATSDLRTNFYNKRLMTQEAFDLHFFRFLNGKIDDTTRAAFLQSGVLSDKQIGLYSSAADTFSLDLTDADRGVDNDGQILDLGNVPSSYYDEIPFENLVGTTYYVGLKYASVPNDTERNPRSSEPEYPWLEDTIGDLGNPDSVTDGGTYIELTVNGILEAAVDHGGRVARVWLNNPVSPDDSISYYEGTVLYTGGNNVVRVPYTPTAGPLGQTAPEYPISLVALDYSVLIPGVSWFKTKDLRTLPEYVFVGTVLGNGGTPTVFDLTDQRPVFLISLDRAYRANSPDTPAPGRTIFADKGAVVIRQTATTQWENDNANTALLVDKLDETIQGGISFSTYLAHGTQIGFPFAAWKNISEGTGSDLEPIEPVTMLAGTNQINWTRAGVDLTTYSPLILGGGCFCLVTGTINGLWDGAYWVLDSGLAPGTCFVSYLDGSTPSFPAGTSGSARLVSYTFASASPDLHAAAYMDLYTAMVGVGKGSGGINLNCRGIPVDPSRQRYIRFQNRITGKNPWGEVYTGRFLMRGGGTSYINRNRTDGNVIGWANFAVDKVSVSDLDADYMPVEAGLDWGFDFRGSSYGKSTVDDQSGLCLAGSFRSPFWNHLEGAGDTVLISEPFTRISATVLQMTRAGFDRANIPGSPTTGSDFVLCEIEFSTPNSEDGVYWVHDNGPPANFEFKKLDGTYPNFPAGGTGVVRFFGGVFFGPFPAAGVGNNVSYMAQIVVPTQKTGGLRLVHRGATAIGTTEFRYLLAAFNDENTVFGIRDGGQVFARAITTKSATAGHGLTQWDQIVTSRIDADDHYGTQAFIDRIDLDVTNRWIRTGNNPGIMNIVKPTAATYSSTSRLVNIFRGISTFNSGGRAWWEPQPDGSESYLRSNGAIVSEYGYYTLPICVPDGATIDSISVYVNPEIGDGTNASFGIKATRRAYTGTVTSDLTATGFQFATSSGLHTETYTPTQNNIVSNASYIYNIHFRSSFNAVSAAINDYVYSASVVFTMPGLGQCWFDVS